MQVAVEIAQTACTVSETENKKDKKLQFNNTLIDWDLTAVYEQLGCNN